MCVCLGLSWFCSNFYFLFFIFFSGAHLLIILSLGMMRVLVPRIFSFVFDFVRGRLRFRCNDMLVRLGACECIYHWAVVGRGRRVGYG